MYNIGRSLLRVEINLQHLWLEAKNLDNPFAFNKRSEVNPYPMCFKVIRDYFRMDENFRTRRFKPVDLRKLKSVDCEIIEMHLAGQDWRTHSVFDGKSSSVQSKKRRQFLEELRLDLNIEWQKQSELLPAYLPKLMQYNNRYKPSAFEREHSFCHPRIKELLIELRKLVEGQSDSDVNGYDLDLS